MINHLKPISPLTIEGIRAWEWCGNAWSDSHAFDSINEFVKNEDNPLAHRAEALLIMGRDGMGLTLEDQDLAPDYEPGKNFESDKQSVEQYLQFIGDNP